MKQVISKKGWMLFGALLLVFPVSSCSKAPSYEERVSKVKKLISENKVLSTEVAKTQDIWKLFDDGIQVKGNITTFRPFNQRDSQIDPIAIKGVDVEIKYQTPDSQQELVREVWDYEQGGAHKVGDSINILYGKDNQYVKAASQFNYIVTKQLPYSQTLRDRFADSK